MRQRNLRVPGWRNSEKERTEVSKENRKIRRCTWCDTWNKDSRTICRRCEKILSQPGKPVRPVRFHAAITWNLGPANGGEGTAGNRNGVPWWWDGDLLLVVVDTNGGPEVSLVRVSADGDQLAFLDAATGDDNFGYTPEDVAWWAKLDPLPPTIWQPA